MSLLRRSVEPLLPDRDYLPLAIPNSAVQVLQVLTRQRSVLRHFSDLTTVLRGSDGDGGPRVTRDVVVANTGGITTHTDKIQLGLAVLGAIVGALGGGQLGLDAAAGTSRSVQYSYTGVLKDYVDLGDLDQWLATADLHNHSGAVSELITAEKLYVVTEVLRATGVAVSLVDSHGQAIRLDVPSIQQLVGGTVRVSASQAVSTAVVVAGTVPITVAAKAAQLKIDAERGFWVKQTPVRGREIRELSESVSYLSDSSGYLPV
jgi:hypothetical protein